MSEWPLRYFVAEWITMSNPSSIGRWIHGLAKVLSETEIALCLRAIFATASRSISLRSGLLGVSTQTMRVFGLHRGFDFRRVAHVDEGEIEIGGAAAHLFEKPVGAAVKIVAHHDVRAAVDRLERGRHRGQTGGESPAARAAFEIGDATFVGAASRIDRARVVVALMPAGTFLDVGGGGVDRRHDRAGGRIGRLTGVNDARGEVLFFLHLAVILNADCGRRDGWLAVTARPATRIGLARTGSRWSVEGLEAMS